MTNEELPDFDDNDILFSIPLKNGKKLKITRGHIWFIMFGPFVITTALLLSVGGIMFALFTIKFLWGGLIG